MENTKLMTGAIPTPRHLLLKATPFLPDFARLDYEEFLHFPEKISIWHNDKYGCCVISEEAFAKGCGEKSEFITDDTVMHYLNKYEGKNGVHILYNLIGFSKCLGDASSRGFHQNRKYYHNGKEFYGVDWTDANTLRQAILKGPIAAGVKSSLLKRDFHTNRQNGWVVTDVKEEESARQDHAVSICGFGSFSSLAKMLKSELPPYVDGKKHGYAMFTWGSIGIVDEQSLLSMTGEAWLRVPLNIIEDITDK